MTNQITPQTAVEAMLATVRDCVANKTFAVIYLAPDDQSVAPVAISHTAGLSHYGLPELLITGTFNPETVNFILKGIGHSMIAALEKSPEYKGFQHLDPITVPNKGLPTLLCLDVRSDVRDALMPIASTYADSKFTAIQIVIPDSEGNYPRSGTSTEQPVYSTI